MEDSLFIVTHRSGFEADPIIDELRRRGLNVFRFNVDDGDNVSFSSIAIDSGELSFECDGRRISNSDIALGWCQQLHPFIGQASTQRETLQRENLLAMQMQGFDMITAPWMNHPRDIIKASNKINQLVHAKKMGFRVPQTLISNDPRMIREFASQGVIIAKNLDTPWIIESNMTSSATTRIVQESWLDNDDALSFAPVIYQQYIKRAKDIRITIVDDHVFAAACRPAPHQLEDIRTGSSTGNGYELYQPSQELVALIQALRIELLLDYCAMDFAEDEAGNLYFLEVNTCGAWWWMDAMHNNGISKAICDTLQSYMGR